MLAIIAIIAVSVIFLLVSLFGKTALENAISKAIGFNIGFKSISVDFDRYVVNLNDFSVYKTAGINDRIFYSGRCVLTLDKQIFEKDKKAVIKELVIEKGVLTLIKNKNGTFNLACDNNQRSLFAESLAYADAGSTQFYNFASNVKKIDIRDSIINFKDNHIPGGPFSISFYDFNLAFRAGDTPRNNATALSADCSLTFKIKNTNYNRNSNVNFNGNFAIYPDRVNMDFLINTEYVDLMQFLPYFRAYTPFSFRSGLFSSNTRYQMTNGMVTSPTVMIFHNLGILIDERAQNAQFLTTSVNRIVPYLTSGGGDIVFDFVLTGPVNNIKGDMGPTVKAAVGLIVMKEIGNAAQQFSGAMSK